MQKYTRALASIHPCFSFAFASAEILREAPERRTPNTTPFSIVPVLEIYLEQ
jgi:hypothetical protein